MNWKTWAPLAVAIVLGLVAAITARNLVSRRPTIIAGAGGAAVVIVKQPILPGQAIKPEDVTTAPLPWKEKPEGTFKDAAEVVGRVATIPMVKGQPVLESLLASPGTGAGLQALVPEGMRAITLEVNEFSSVGGLIVPGCSVDIVATIEDARTKERLARTIVQAVKVMAIGQHIGAPAPAAGSKDAPASPDQFKSVTLLTTPAEAEALELASMVGRPRLVLRGAHDTAAAKSAGISVAQLAGQSEDANAFAMLAPSSAHVQPAELVQPKAAAATQPAYDQQVVKVIRGGAETTVTFNVPRPFQPVSTPATLSRETITDTVPGEYAVPH